MSTYSSAPAGLDEPCCCLQIYWLVFEGQPTYPSDTQAAGRQAYQKFLAEAQQGISNKRLKVAAKKAPVEKQQQNKQKDKQKKRKRES